MKRLEVAGITFVIVMLTTVVMPIGPAAASERDDQTFKGSIKVERGADFNSLAKIAPEDAKNSTMKKYPNAEIKSIRLQEENGYLVYEVLLLNNNKKLDVKVDAGNGEIVKVDNDRENDREKGMEDSDEGEANPYNASLRIKNPPESALHNLAKVSMQDAIASAVEKVPGKVVKTELDNENGYLVYSVEVAVKNGDIKDVKIDAGNGKVLFVNDDPDDDRQWGEENKEEDDD